jgi:hypothetical protein
MDVDDGGFNVKDMAVPRIIYGKVYMLKWRDTKGQQQGGAHRKSGHTTHKGWIMHKRLMRSKQGPKPWEA